MLYEQQFFQKIAFYSEFTNMNDRQIFAKINCFVIIVYLMKSQSLLSERSNLSQLSNVSYRGEKKEYTGAQFFKQSLPPGHNHGKSGTGQFKQEQIQLSSLGPTLFKHITPIKQSLSAFQPYWTSDLLRNNEGVSDNQSQSGQIMKKQEEVLKLQIQSNKNEIKESNQIGESENIQSDGRHQYESYEISEKAMKNETKNIPKNYGKAIIIFFENNRELLEKILEQNGDSYEKLLQKLLNLKKKINTILDLRNLWQNHPESRSLRIVSNYFLRKHSLNYIYNSRIKTRLCHAKYKRRLQQAIVNPQQFHHIKDY